MRSTCLLLAACVLTGCSQQSPDVRADPDLCPPPVDGRQCTQDVVRELRTELRRLAGSGPLAPQQYEQAVGSVLSDGRIAADWSYERLDEVPEQDDAPVTPVRFRLSTAGHVSQWWVCLPGPGVQEAPCR